MKTVILTYLFLLSLVSYVNAKELYNQQPVPLQTSALLSWYNSNGELFMELCSLFRASKIERAIYSNENRNIAVFPMDSVDEAKSRRLLQLMQRLKIKSVTEDHDVIEFAPTNYTLSSGFLVTWWYVFCANKKTGIDPRRIMKDIVDVPCDANTQIIYQRLEGGWFLLRMLDDPRGIVLPRRGFEIPVPDAKTASYGSWNNRTG
jgi:hypothetical protein